MAGTIDWIMYDFGIICYRAFPQLSPSHPPETSVGCKIGQRDSWPARGVGAQYNSLKTSTNMSCYQTKNEGYHTAETLPMLPKHFPCSSQCLKHGNVAALWNAIKSDYLKCRILHLQYYFCHVGNYRKRIYKQALGSDRALGAANNGIQKWEYFVLSALCSAVSPSWTDTEDRICAITLINHNIPL